MNKFAQLEKNVAVFWGLTHNEFQRVGCGFDFISPNGQPVELKMDLRASETGNTFLEISQTFDNMRNWQPSGASLSVAQADIFCIATSSTIYIIPREFLRKLLEDAPKYKTVHTRTGANGNKSTSYAKGLLVPLALLTKYCLLAQRADTSFNEAVKTA